MIMSLIHPGEVPCTEWKTSSRILKAIRSVMGSRWRDFSEGVMWDVRSNKVTRRAVCFRNKDSLENVMRSKTFERYGKLIQDGSCRTHSDPMPDSLAEDAPGHVLRVEERSPTLGFG